MLKGYGATDMRAQVIATMRKGFARRYAVDHSVFDAGSLLKGFVDAEVIGAPGFSTRISLAKKDVQALRQRLYTDFIVEPDHVLSTFQAKRIPLARGLRARPGSRPMVVAGLRAHR